MNQCLLHYRKQCALGTFSVGLRKRPCHLVNSCTVFPGVAVRPLLHRTLINEYLFPIFYCFYCLNGIKKNLHTGVTLPCEHVCRVPEVDTARKGMHVLTR